ncbi:unnamed protein product [Orchesella dallaii]|uniref:NAD(+)--protein-arginine ADP-ribosyltransferase n=1 Tax=Orchesella dallaii TaxID=48710 RepID=A0ABP1PLM9_9HEXA
MKTSSEDPVQSHEEYMGINQSHPNTDHNETLSVKKEDQIHNLTGNETYNLNVTNLNETLPRLESEKVFNFTRNETYNLNVTNFTETSPRLESGKVFNFTRRDETSNLIVTANLNKTLTSGLVSANGFNFTEKENHNDTDTHHHKHFNDTNYNETVQSEEVINFSGNETYNDTDHQSHLNVTYLNETLPDLDFEKVYNFTEIEEFNATYNGTSNFTSFDNLTTTTTPTTTTTTTTEYVYRYYWVPEPEVITEHIDFVLLRLKHISMRSSSNITELLELQQEEFEINLNYKYGWGNATEKFNSTLRERIYSILSNDSIVRQVPEEYHIAIIAYTGSMYEQFNTDTKEVCSGKDIDGYKWKSFFKLLQLAIETLGTHEEKWRDSHKFIYRGVPIKFVLKEGQVIAFQQFVSATASLKEAQRSSSRKALFEFQGLYNGTAMSVWDHWNLTSKKEYLFSPLQTFRVDSIHFGYYYTRYVLVKHEMPVLCDLKTTRPKFGRNTNITSSFLRAHSGTEGHGHYVLKIKFIMLLLHIVHSIIA